MPRDRHWPSVVDVVLFMDEVVDNSAPENQALIEQQVLRNLEVLLNTRRGPTWPPTHLEETLSSSVAYGINDFTCSSFVDSPDRRTLCSELRKAIRAYEPRLKNVQVEDLNGTEELDRILHFRIRAQLLVYPNPHRIVFDSRLDRATAQFEVSQE